MKVLGYTRLTTGTGVFVCQLDNGTIFLAIIYVDDALFIGPNQDFLCKKKAEFMAKWECRDLGEGNQDFLKMRIQRELNKFSIDPGVSAIILYQN